MENMFPISWDGEWDGDMEVFIMMGVTFLEDFGPFVKGETVDLAWDQVIGKVESYAINGKVMKSCLVKVVPR